MIVKTIAELITKMIFKLFTKRERENVMLNMITKTRIATIKTVHITTVYGPFFAFSDIGKDKQ